MVGDDGKPKLPASYLAKATVAVAAEFVGQNIEVLCLSSQISRVRFALLFAIRRL